MAKKEVETTPVKVRAAEVKSEGDMMVVIGGDGLADGETTYGEDIKGMSTYEATANKVVTETDEE